MSDVPSQARVESVLLTLRPDATWDAHFVFGVSVRRLDRPGAWYRVGMYEGDVLRRGDDGVLDLMDAAHAIRLGLGRYEPRFERWTCGVCAQPTPGSGVTSCQVCVVTVCADCHNRHAESHAEYYAQMAVSCSGSLAAEKVASPYSRSLALVQMELGL